MILLLIGVAITLWASYNIKATFKKYSQLRYSKNATAEVVANWILKQNGITNVRIEHIPGSLTDHYDPTQKVLRLSDSVYGSVSMAAIGVAAHECGHAIQDNIAYQPLVTRRKLVPIANIGSTISYPVILLGIIFGATGLLNIGIILFSAVVVFQLVTLPVEFDASKRACAILEGSNRFFSGFIFPKYSLANADEYNSEFLKVLSQSSKQFYMMPILESEDIVDYATRPSVLIQLKQKIDDMKDHVLNVRVGGNDFSNAFGVRRHIDETIYDILPVSQLLCDILTVFSRDYVVSGPVWEYYSSNNDEWAIGLKRELKYDVLNGFVGKTVIHPNQIPVVVDSLKVKKQDYDDAMEILSWRDDSALLVGGSAQKERMNEVNTHLRWAKRVASLAAVYGVQND